MLTISHCCSYAPVISSCPLVLIPALSLLPVSAFSYWRLALASQPLLGYSWLLSSWLLSGPRTLVPTLSTWFPLLAGPGLQRPCSRAWSSSCHGPPHVMVQVSATDQMPSPPGSLRQRVACLISGPTAPFILVFSPGYNHELDSPGKQYLQYPLHPNYREQQAEIPACTSVRAETPYHVY